MSLFLFTSVMPATDDIFSMSMANIELPKYAEHLVPLTGMQLIRQGAILHFATVNSCLRVSKAFRKRHGKRWLQAAIQRFYQECGMNVALFAVLILMNFMIFSDHLLIANLLAIIMPSTLSVLQLSVDHIRPDAAVYYDPKTFAGLSVKKRSGDAVGWQFFNHYAFPVGQHHGMAIRSQLHHQAQLEQRNLSCIPQNSDLRSYYESEQATYLQSNGKLLTWNYTVI